MSGGSAEAEGPHDKQCPHCNRYYMDRGNSFNMHKAACGGSDEDSTQEATADAPEPSGGDGGLGIPSDNTAAETGSEADMHKTPCGCEEFDAAQLDIPEDGVVLACDTCGQPFEVHP